MHKARGKRCTPTRRSAGATGGSSSSTARHRVAGNGEILHMFSCTDEKKATVPEAGRWRGRRGRSSPRHSWTSRGLIGLAAAQGFSRTRRRRTGDRSVPGAALVERQGAWTSSQSSWRSNPTPTAIPTAARAIKTRTPSTPGITIEPVPVMGHRGRGWTGRPPSSTYDGVRVPGGQRLRRAGRRLPHRAEAPPPC